MATEANPVGEKRMRWHYINLTRKEYVVARSSCNYLVMRLAMKDIGWSSKDTIICFDNSFVLGCELPNIWNEETEEFSEYFLTNFKNVSEHPIGFETNYEVVRGYCGEKWYQFLADNNMPADDD